MANRNAHHPGDPQTRDSLIYPVCNAAAPNRRAGTALAIKLLNGPSSHPVSPPAGGSGGEGAGGPAGWLRGCPVRPVRPYGRAAARGGDVMRLTLSEVRRLAQNPVRWDRGQAGLEVMDRLGVKFEGGRYFWVRLAVR